MTIEEIKNISLVEYLEGLGYHAHKKNGNRYWFLSPLHQEKSASFKVDKAYNLWYDFALGRGGNIINLAQLLNPQYSMHQVLLALAQYINHSEQPTSESQPMSESDVPQNDPTQIELMKDLTNRYLIEYIYSRDIDMRVAIKYCKEVHYSLASGKKYYGIAFSNLSGGMEVRNKYAKRCIGRKDISLILQTPGERTSQCCVFEGFFDFLAYETARLYDNRLISLPYPCDCIIMNSVSNTKKTLFAIQGYDVIHCYLDNDKAGRDATYIFIESMPQTVCDQSIRYRDCNDVNDYLTEIMHNI